MSLIDVRPAGAAGRYALPITGGVSVGPPEAQFLFGGAGLAAAIAAVEAETGRPTVWAAAQYLSYARPPATLDLDVVVPVTGRHSSQARITGHVGDTEILTVNAALGQRPASVSTQWPTMPAAPPPGDCPAMTYGWRRSEDDVHAHIEQRIAAGRFGPDRSENGPSTDGRSMMWARSRDPGAIVDRVMLALIADFLPAGIGHALGAQAGANSLDNTIRFAHVVPTEWVLLDIHIHAVHDGFAHGAMRLFAEDGTLMALGSQSMIVRTF